MGQAPQSLVGRGLAADAFGVVPGDDGQGRGGHRAGAVDVKQRAGGSSRMSLMLPFSRSACSLRAFHALPAAFSATSMPCSTVFPLGRHAASPRILIEVRDPR